MIFINKIITQTIKKVPEITIYFWAIKLLTTAMGEVTSDYLAHQLHPIVAVCLGGIGFVFALLLQFSVRRYIPWIYWLTVSMVAIFGTMVADVLHVGFGIPYIVSTMFFGISLAIIFFVWYKSEKTLSIHSIYTFHRELFYWATVVTTFALGTAVGDMTASTMGLGYFASGILFLLFIGIPFLSYKMFKANSILMFWIAYILTRPLGASFADWIGRSKNLGGLGFGTGIVSLFLIGIIVLFVTYITVRNENHRESKSS